MTFLRRLIPGFRMGAILLALQALAVRVYAAPAGGGLPWEKPLSLIATSLTGPVAYAIGLIGICIAGIIVVSSKSSLGVTRASARGQEHGRLDRAFPPLQRRRIHSRRYASCGELGHA